jgi:spore coat polysaccharide biosynthesis predicted glycosyltransferase SpsG
LFDLNKKFISKMEQKLISKIENRKAIFAENNFLQNKNNLFIAPYQLKKKFFHSKKNVLLGPKFCIFKKELIKTAKMKKNPKKIISVCMGGSDPKNLTLKVVLHLLKINNFEDYKFIFIVGKLYKKRNFFLLKKICQKKNNFKIVRDPKNIYKIFFQSKIAIINSGNLKYELSALKVPFILLSNEKKSHFYNQLFAKKFYCFFNTNINDQIKNIEPILKKTFKSKKILPNFTKNNFHKVDLNSKFVLVKKVTKFYNEKK